MNEKIMLSSAKRRIFEPYSKTCSSESCQWSNEKIVKDPLAPASSDFSVWEQSAKPPCYLRPMEVL